MGCKFTRDANLKLPKCCHKSVLVGRKFTRYANALKNGAPLAGK